MSALFFFVVVTQCKVAHSLWSSHQVSSKVSLAISWARKRQGATHRSGESTVQYSGAFFFYFFSPSFSVSDVMSMQDERMNVDHHEHSERREKRATERRERERGRQKSGNSTTLMTQTAFNSQEKRKIINGFTSIEIETVTGIVPFNLSCKGSMCHTSRSRSKKVYILTHTYTSCW